MRTEAEKHAEEDQKRRALVQSKNAADNAIYATDKILSEATSEFLEQIQGDVTEKVAKVRESLATEDPAFINTATNELLQYLQSIGATIHERPSQPLGEESAESASAANE